jgi:glutathione S-transferase
MAAQLSYWSGQGNAEIIRLMMMAACGEPWEDRVALDDAGASHLSTPEQMEKLMGAGLLAFDQTPLLQIDGLNLVQKMAAVRYLARKHSLYGRDNEEATLIDILSEGVLDFGPLVLQQPEDQAAAAAGFDKYLPRFERALGTNAFLAGDALSFADVLLFHVFERLREREELDVALSSYPSLAALEQRIRAVPTLAAYLGDSTKHFPHPGLPGYMDRVTATIPWIKPDGPPPPSPRSAVWHYKQQQQQQPRGKL